MNELIKEVIASGTELSKAGNNFLGDRTGRTITKTHMEGFANFSNGTINPSGELVHTLMIGTLIFLCSKNKTIAIVGISLLAILLIAYLSGRE